MRVAFYTLGCKVNQYETEVLSARFAAEGFDVVPGHAPGCDVYVVGSCTVTAEGDRKTRQAVRRFRRENPGAIVVLTGCYPQAFPREAAAVTEADIVTGARNRAAAMPDQVSPADKKRRCAELIAVAAELRKTALTAMLGQTQLVLFESRGQQGCTGYTPNYTPVTVCDPAAHPGDIRPVLLTAIAPDADGCEGILTD